MSEEQEWNAKVIAEFRANGGEVAAPYPDPPPMLLLHTIGARTGKEHIAPMRCLIDGNTRYVFASAHGSASNPDWYYNLMAHPVITVEQGTETLQMRASEVVGAERDGIFARHAARFPVFLDYAQRLARTIPVIRLDPVAPAINTSPPRAQFAVEDAIAPVATDSISGADQPNVNRGAVLAMVGHGLLAWPGVVAERIENGPTGIGVTVYRLGRFQIGHIHDDGSADFLVPRALRRELVRDGRAAPHPAFPEEQTVVSYQIRGEHDLPGVLDLFKINYERLSRSGEGAGADV